MVHSFRASREKRESIGYEPEAGCRFRITLLFHLRSPIQFYDFLFNLLSQKSKPKPKLKAKPKAKSKPEKFKSKSKKESEEEESEEEEEEEEEEESEDVDISEGSDSDWKEEVPRS